MYSEAYLGKRMDINPLLRMLAEHFEEHIELGEIRKQLDRIQQGQVHIMAAIDDVKASEAALVKAVGDIVSYLKTLATTVTGGISEADAEKLASDISAQAAALEAAIPVPPVVVPPVTTPPVTTTPAV